LHPNSLEVFAHVGSGRRTLSSCGFTPAASMTLLAGGSQQLQVGKGVKAS